jgi:flagellar assembly factor FliW
MARCLQSRAIAMPSVETKYFGVLPYTDESLFDFPQGLPAFEDQKGFVLIQSPEKAPLVFLQSVARASLCFVALPVQLVDKNHQLAIAPEDLEDLALETRRQPVVGGEVMVLALVSLHGEFLATANLMAPIVLNVKTRRGLQAIRRDTRYSHEYPLSGQAVHQSTEAEIC